MHRLAAEPCSTAGLLSPSRCPSGTILLTPYSMVWDWRVSRAGPMLLYWPKLLYPYYGLLLFPFFFFLSIGWYCGAGVFGLIGCISPSPSLALPTLFNNNNNELVTSLCTLLKFVQNFQTFYKYLSCWFLPRWRMNRQWRQHLKRELAKHPRTVVEQLTRWPIYRPKLSKIIEIPVIKSNNVRSKNL